MPAALTTVLDIFIYRHVAAIQRGGLENRPQSPDADEQPLAAAAGDRHTGDQLQRIGDIFGGEFADVLGRYGVDDAVGIALGIQSPFDTAAVAAVDNDFL